MIDRKKAPKARPRSLLPEEVWIREFVEFHSTDNVIRFSLSTLKEVSLTRAIEALTRGRMIGSEKRCDPGTDCVIQHESDSDLVEVHVFFEANRMHLQILKAILVKEKKGEPDAA